MPILAVTGRTWLVVVSAMRDALDYRPREVTHEWGRIHLTWFSPLSLRSMSATGFQPLPVSPRPWTITISYSRCHSGIEHWVDRLMTPTWMKMTVAVCFEIAGRSKCLRGYEVICGDLIIWECRNHPWYDTGIYRGAIRRSGSGNGQANHYFL